jgi:energy-coupling factor transporter ATP-binding protein EcfA2
VRVTKIEVCDFRGFPGPAVYDFEFSNARNLLIYGENGSGKSSLFRAIQEFFNRSKTAKPFVGFKNINQPALTDGHVAVHFDNGAMQQWPFGGARPVNTPPASQAALQVGCLDYRSLLETNFSQKGDTVNLFDIAVNHLVDRMEVMVEGGSAKIGDLWRAVLSSRPWANYKRYVRQCVASVERFNGAFEPVLTPLMDKASKLLQKFPGCQFELGVSFQPIEYHLKSKTFTHQELILSVKQGGVTVQNHHDFLNEARLSAIGLVIYLAGLLNTVPPGSPHPKLLVLDDVLIGLDMQNRMPVLEVLAEYFTDWQVILMTFDKVWYEMLQLQLEGKTDWKAYELYVGDDFFPRHQPREGGWDYFLARARRHLSANDERAAAVYARAAFESKVKKYCDERSVPVPYKKDPRSMSAEAFWQAAQKRALAEATDPALKADLPLLIAAIDSSKKIVLNPLSHSEAAAVTRHEVQAAIDAVDKLRFK